jgi:hypothetical protein
VSVFHKVLFRAPQACLCAGRRGNASPRGVGGTLGDTSLSWWQNEGRHAIPGGSRADLPRQGCAGEAGTSGTARDEGR